jgi:integration host factor subunit alpha
MALTKADIADNVVGTCRLARADARQLVDNVFELIRQTLESGEAVHLSSFGNFELRTKEERPGRNPKTGEIAFISARRVVTFHPGQKLRDRVEQYEPEEN